MQLTDQSPSTKQNTNLINHSNRDPNFERPKQSSSKIYPKNENTTPAKNVAVNESLVVDKERSSPTKTLFKNSTNKNKQVVTLIENNTHLSADILRIQTEAKCSDIINLTNDENLINTESKNSVPVPNNNGQEWKTVRYKRRNGSIVIGNNENSEISGVQNLVIFMLLE
uniref:Uncharacterized protein LOC114345325 n=1 Tax=Diabrotica virgifera virgifera TaxID=50390 RepID=A0A6P7H7N8_DIAVI